MTSTSVLVAWATSNLGSLVLAAAVAAQPPPSAPAASTGGMARVFAAGLNMLGLVFKGIGSLAGGAAAGAIWRADIRTGERQHIGHADDLAWPVPSPDGISVYALRGRQVVRIAIADGLETPVGAPAGWRKLLGVLRDGTALGFIEDDPRPRPALLGPDGGLTELPPPADDAERERNGALLQEARDYADGTRLEVRDSERGGRGRDVFLIGGAGPRNLTDCGDDFCSQPSRSQDALAVFYIRGPRL
jgi:hypothetical protein